MIIVVAAVIGVAIIGFTLWSIKFIASGPPPEPDISDVEEVDIPYLCTVCGLSLTVTQAHGGDVSPPRHCREDMVQA